ncbi:MAG: hypothetical protein N2Z75_05915 [Meiothermus sp.]|nr:hypothetical protein [Meiothermus sp.]
MSKPILAHIPLGLRHLPQWVVWRYEEREGKRTKLPYRPHPQHRAKAKANDPATWGTLEAALTALETHRMDGLGFVFAQDGGIVGIDLDWKTWSGEGVPPEAKAIVDRLDSYTEWSPSRRGCHILLRGHLPPGVGNRKQLAPDVELEVYDHGRFFTMTGERWEGPTDLEDRQAELEALLLELFPPRVEPQETPKPTLPTNLDDGALLEHMFASKHGADIRRLYEGNTDGYASHSEADLALAGHLMWWTGNDTGRADRLFRQSGLYRPKWDEKHHADGRTYGEGTLERAWAADPYDPHKVSAGHSPTPAEAREAYQQAVKILEGLTPETWPEQRAALLEALQGLDPVSVDLLLKQAAGRLGVGVGAMQKALREHAKGDEAEPTAAKELARLALEYSEFWKDGEGAAWATLQVEDHKENWPVRSRAFRLWLTRLYYEERGRPPNAQALQDALSAVEAKALFAGAEHPVHLRVAHQDGAVWLDLGRPDWQAVRITAEGWAVLPPEVRFRRSKATGALPIPIQGGGALKDILSPWALEEAPLTLVLAWALGTLSAGPYPVLALSGEQGSGKSTLARTLQRLIDPSGDVGSLPRESRDLFIAAKHSHVLAFDNVSGLPPWLSDDLCKLATGGLLRARELYTNDEEVFLQAKRPVILNGITDYLTRQDLVDRSILLHLPPLEQHQPEAELWAAFQEAHPRALGGLLDLAALALRELPRTRSPNVRLADFARWALAAESGYAKVGVFEQAFTEMRADAVRVALDNEPLYPMLLRLLEGGPFEGSAGELLEQLNALRGEGKKPPEGWPRTPHAVASWLKRTAPALRKVGVQVDPLKRERDKRRWKIAMQKEGGEQTSQMSPMSEARAGRTSEVTFPSPGDVSNVTANVTLPPGDISPPPGDVSNVTPNGPMSPEESRAGRIGDIDDVCDISTPHLSTQEWFEDADVF